VAIRVGGHGKAGVVGYKRPPGARHASSPPEQEANVNDAASPSDPASAFGRGNAFARSLGVEMLERGRGSARFAFTARPQDLNAQGVVHGGMLAGLMDLLLAMAAGAHPDPAERRFSITLSMTINFVGAAPPGRLICHGREVGGGRNTVFCDGRIETADGTLIATGQGSFKLLPAGSEGTQ